MRNLNSLNRLDLKGALSKVKHDRGWGLRIETFVVDPYEFELIIGDDQECFKSIGNRLNVGYVPCYAVEVPVPKGDGQMRWVNLLSLEDHLVYSALVLECVPKIREVLQWSAGSVRFSNILLEDQSGGNWVEFPMNSWKSFRSQSEEFAKESKSVVFADIEGFYDNIDTEQLICELEIMGVKGDILDLLKRCLYKWNDGSGNGVPQGYSASNILTEFYLDSIDYALKCKGFNHVRFVDDFRIFCDSEAEAMDACCTLSELCMDKGLKLKDSKTRIVPGNKALKEIQGIDPIIKVSNGPIQDQKDFRTLFKNFILNNKGFDKSLFHYLLNRIFEPYFVKNCQSIIFERPEETKQVLIYFNNLVREGYDLMGVVEDLAVKLLAGVGVYEYQKYLFLKWIFENKIVSPSLLKIVGDVSGQEFGIGSIRNFCVAYMGDNGGLPEIPRLRLILKQTNDNFTMKLTYKAIGDILERYLGSACEPISVSVNS